MPEGGSPTYSSLIDWHPDAAEVATIVAEMRPIIVLFAERSRRLLASPICGS